MKKLLFIFLACQLAVGQDSVYLHQSDAAPFTGFLVPQLKVEELQRKSIELTNTKLLNDSLQKSLSLQNSINSINEDKLTIVLKQNDSLAKSLSEERNTSDWTKAFWFSLGIAATILSVYGASKVTR